MDIEQREQILMHKIENLRELQLVETKILKEFIQFCEKYNLRTYMIGGSLIGAVRHKGFIPWDDDIDVSMPRPDYDKLIALHKRGIRISNDCYLLSAETDGRFNGYIPQVVCRKSKMLSGQYREKEELKIGLSIFVYDGLPKHEFGRKLYFKKMYILRSMHALCRANFQNVNTKIAKKVGPLLQPLFKSGNTKRYRNKVLLNAKRYVYQESVYVAPNADASASKELVKRERYERAIELEFEGIKCYAASNYEEHLRKYYGDYMQLPPVEERKAKHGFDAWIEEGFITD